MRPGKANLTEQARSAVERRLTARGYRVDRDEDARSGRLTVASPTCRFEVYVAGASGWGYPFWTERRLTPARDRFVAIARFPDSQAEPELYLIPTVDWERPELPLVNPQYEGLKSEAEYGVRLSASHFDALQRYQWDRREADLPT